MENKKSDYWLKVFVGKIPFILITASTLVLVGIIFLCISQVGTNKEQSRQIDYTDCLLYSFTSDVNITCAESMLNDNEPCVCFHQFNITEDLEGKIIVYYELESFDQLKSDYINSRDVNQLKGELLQIPSENCEPYRYDEILGVKKPIFPCGSIADSMFNDTYELTYISSNKDVLFINNGILSDADKFGYHNPENTTDLKNFTKPRNWSTSIWELDTTNPENNGVQNEIFIGWMKTEWKRKPYARVVQNETYFEKGLPAGQYRLRVGYNYSPTRYNGRRKFIISATQSTSNISFTIIGIISLVLGLIVFAMALAAFLMYKRIKEKVESNNRDLDAHETLT